jgi:hypothetical protein
MLITAEKRIKENTHVYNASVKYGIKFLFFGKNARTGQFIFLSCHLLAYVLFDSVSAQGKQLKKFKCQ